MTRHQGGFSLIEILIAITILGGVSILLSQSFFSLTRVNTKVEVVKDLKQSGDFAIRSVEQMIRQNTGIVSACSTGGSTSTSLAFTNPDGNTTTLGCIYDSTSRVTRLASSSATKNDFLTSANASLGGTSCSSSEMTLEFTCTSFPSQPNVVRISFNLSQAGSGPTPATFEQGSTLFETTVNARN